MNKTQDAVEFSINEIDIVVKGFEEIVERCFREARIDPNKEDSYKKRQRKWLQREIEYDIESHVEELECGEVEETDGEIVISFDSDMYGGDSDYRSITLYYTLEEDWKGRYRKAVVMFPEQ